MSDFKTRLEAEQDELAEKMVKLEGFISSINFNTIDPVQQRLLKIQLKAMATYYECLLHRIELL